MFPYLFLVRLGEVGMHVYENALRFHPVTSGLNAVIGNVRAHFIVGDSWSPTSPTKTRLIEAVQTRLRFESTDVYKEWQEFPQRQMNDISDTS